MSGGSGKATGFARRRPGTPRLEAVDDDVGVHRVEDAEEPAEGGGGVGVGGSAGDEIRHVIREQRDDARVAHEDAAMQRG